ncbi:MAG TPA: polysaccharide biosynthesis tyrosine autokinase [Pyrinomonadaceae bacterium]|nr:polysaccharide biosynthesis tyrosine autokinase [Pyrinomonadaceae bacterium]
MQDNRLLPLPSSPESLDRPLRELTQPAPVASGGAASEPAHLREYVAVVLKRKWLILSLMVVITSLVAIQMYRLPSTYEAWTQIQIEQKSKNVLSTGRGGDLIIRSNDPNYWNTQLKKLNTQKLARQVIMRLDLQNNPAFLGAGRGTGIIVGLRRIISREKAPPTPQQAAGSLPVLDDAELNAEQLTPEQARKLEPFEDSLRENLTIEPVDRTNLVFIRFRHTDPQVAAKVANTIAIVFRDNDIREETSGSERANDLLAKQIIELQTKIQEDEAARLAYMTSKGIPLGAKPGQDLNALRLSTYSSQLQQAEADRKDAESSYKAATETRDRDGLWSIPQVQSDKTVQRLREKISELKEQRAGLLVNYTEDWPAVKKIDEQLKRLEAELEETPKEIVAGMKTKFEAAKKKEAELRSSYASEHGKANVQSVAEMGLSDWNQRIETNKQLYQTYLQRQRELNVTAGERSTGNVSTVEEARVPVEPIGPPRVRNIIIAFLLSLAVGIGLAFLLDYLDDTLKSVEDVDRHLHLPTLALIPAPREARRLLSRHAPEPEPGTNTALALIQDVRSPVAEAYRHLRTSLLLSSAGQPPKTVLVTSSQPSEGKTTTVVNIATMLAQTGADVLVLDCDLRRPRVHAHFGLPNARGVTNYLSGDATVSDLVQTYGPLQNLKVITSGPVPPNAAELLGSDEMRKLLYVLAENFTHIIIDSPPAISFTDASILSTMVDGVMLVVHGGRSSRTVVRRAKQQLQDVGAHLFGIVLNNVKLEGSDYYYYSGYYSGYYSADEEGAPEGAEAAGAGDGRGAS